MTDIFDSGDELDTTGKYYTMPPPPPTTTTVEQQRMKYDQAVDQAYKSVNPHFYEQLMNAPYIMHQPMMQPDPMATWDTIHRSAQNNASPEKLSHLFTTNQRDDLVKGLSGLTLTTEAKKPVSPIYEKTWPRDVHVNNQSSGRNFDSGYPSPDSSPSSNWSFEQTLSSLEDFNLSGLTQTSGSSFTGSTLNQNLFGPYSPRRPVVHEITLDNCTPNLKWTAPTSPLRYTREQSRGAGDLSRQVFLGGIPWGCDDESIERAFARYGRIEVKWPPHSSSPSKASNGSSSNNHHASGFCYVIFDSDKQVEQLVDHCIERKGCYYLNQRFAQKMRAPTSNRRRDSRCKPKEVEVIPWWTKDTKWDSAFTQDWKSSSDEKKQIFIGGLHGMMTAELIATMLRELFGSVKLVVIDTDQTNYPTGSGRAVFHKHADYVKAIEGRFVLVEHVKFTKRIQIDPFLQDGKFCEMDKACKNIGTRFCRSATCLKYYCEKCYDYLHERSSMHSHTYTVKQQKN